MAGFFNRFTINGYIEGLFYPDIDARTYAYYKLIEKGEKALPFIEAKRLELERAYIEYREKSGTPFGATPMAGESSAHREYVDKDIVLKNLAEEIMKNTSSNST